MNQILVSGFDVKGLGVKVLTDMRSGQDASSPHWTVTHREQLLGFTGQLKDKIWTVHMRDETFWVGLASVRAYLPITRSWSFTPVMTFRHTNEAEIQTFKAF